MGAAASDTGTETGEGSTPPGSALPPEASISVGARRMLKRSIEAPGVGRDVREGSGAPVRPAECYVARDHPGIRSLRIVVRVVAGPGPWMRHTTRTGPETA